MKKKVIAFLQNEVDAGLLPGAVVQVTHKGEVLLKEAIGYRSVIDKDKHSMELDTVFDLASLTKVVATLPSVLKLMDKGKVTLNDRVAYFLPEFGRIGKEEIQLVDLLSHSSGLTAVRDFYSEPLTKDEIYERIYAEPLAYPTGSKVVYSDLGFMLLSQIVEKVSDVPFEDFVQENILDPLDMTDTGFVPQFPKDRYAATEYSEKDSQYKLGIVHDKNAEAMGGISGHAGLFSTVEDLGKYATMIENGGKSILSPVGLKLARKNMTPFSTEHRGLGWMLKGPEPNSIGDYLSDETYGHTGFTGTSIFFDPVVDLNVILLTNRVHFGREPSIVRVRQQLHNMIRSHF